MLLWLSMSFGQDKSFHPPARDEYLRGCRTDGIYLDMSSDWSGPPSNQAMQKLAESGVKTIVDLRLAGPGAAEEATKAKKLGIKYVHIPLGFMGPSLFKVAQFLNIVNDPANQPVFVHCRYGADRTGALVAVFRVIHDHWTFSQAYTEMRSHHFKPWLASLKLMVARVGGNAKIQQELKTLANKSLASSNL